MTARKSADLQLPTVSVVIVNYNYAAFVAEALLSVADQTYPNLEIVVVDDHSSDNSWEVIGQLIATDPRLADVSTFRLESNTGHMGAAAFGYERSRGAYVIFLDADDILLPRCIETHIYAHLSSRLPVGFSSVRSLTFRAREIIATGVPDYAAEFVASGIGRLSGMVRPLDQVSEGLWPVDLGHPLEADDIHFTRPPKCDPWVWSTLSAHCFRRDALRLFLEEPIEHSRAALDGYLVIPIAALCGSMVIDKLLMGYRMHGRNEFAASAPLLRLRSYDARSGIGLLLENRKRSILRMVTQAETFAPLCESPEYFFAALVAQCRSWPLGSEYGDPHFLSDILQLHRDLLTRAFGDATVNGWVARLPT